MNRADYIAFHNATTAALAAGTAAADVRCLVYSTQSFSATPQGQVRKNVVGGFADRLKGVATAFYLAVATDRYFMIDWPDPRPLETDLTAADIQWRARFDALGLQKGDVQLFNMIDDNYEPHRAAITSGDIESIWGTLRCPVININRIAPEVCDNPRYASHLQSFLQSSLCEQEFFYQAYRTLFTYAPHDAEVKQAYDTLAARLLAKPYRLGVQFRTGGDGKWPDPRLDAHENYTLLMQAAEAKLRPHGDNAALFVTTDSASVKQRIIDEYSARFDIVYLDVPPVHYERSGAGVNGGASIGSSFMIAENTLLGLCDEVICGAGGFGIIGAWRQNRPATHYAYGPITKAVLMPTPPSAPPPANP